MLIWILNLKLLSWRRWNCWRRNLRIKFLIWLFLNQLIDFVMFWLWRILFYSFIIFRFFIFSIHFDFICLLSNLLLFNIFLIILFAFLNTLSSKAAYIYNNNNYRNKNNSSYDNKQNNPPSDFISFRRINWCINLNF
jgi:signal transduction histidine kinase